MNQEANNKIQNLLEQSEVFPKQISQVLIGALNQLTEDQIILLSQILNEEKERLKSLK